jgi:hypothetical protein
MSTPTTRSTTGKRKECHLAEPNEAALQHLREVIYHKLKMWDASLAAERLLGRNFDTGSPIDCLCSSIGDAEDAMTLTESDLKDAFDF